MGVKVNGRRGAFLLLFGIAHMLNGWSLLTLEFEPGTRPGLELIQELGLPPDTGGVLWIVSGLVAFVCAFIKTSGRDGTGFVVLVIVDTLWAGFYMWSWIFSDYERGWIAAVVYAALAGSVYVVSGMISARRAKRFFERTSDSRNGGYSL